MMKGLDMADAGGSWGGLSAWEALIGGGVALASFLGGIWTRGAASGKSEGNLDARIIALGDRMTHIERKFERSDATTSKMAERISETPTRSEMAAYFQRIEQRLDDFMSRRHEK